MLLDGQTDGGIVYGLGVVNGRFDDAPDFNNSKHILTRLGWAGEKASVLANLLWGNNDINDADPGITVDLVATFDPTDSLSTWMNFTWSQNMNQPGPVDTSEGWGIAAAARYAFTDALGLALRAEYIADSDNFFGVTQPGVVPGPATDIDAVSLTVTGDYAITDSLTLKGEVRWDWMDSQTGGSDNFLSNGADALLIQNAANYSNDNQWLTGLELVYQF